MTDEMVGVWDMKPEGGGAPVLVRLTAADAADRVASDPKRYARDAAGDGTGKSGSPFYAAPVAVNPAAVQVILPASSPVAGLAQRVMDAHSGLMTSTDAYVAACGELQAKIDAATAALKGEADKVAVG